MTGEILGFGPTESLAKGLGVHENPDSNPEP